MAGLGQWVKKHLVLVVVGGGIVGSIAFVVGIKVADLPAFCSVFCHEMQYYVDSLEVSRHTHNPEGKEVICMDCHSEQGFMNHAIEHIRASILITGHFTEEYKEDYLNKHAEFKKDFEGRDCQECHPGRSQLAYFMEVPEPKWGMLNENCRRCHEDMLEEKILLKNKLQVINVSHKLHSDKGILCTKCHKLVVHGTDPEGFNRPAKHICFAECHDGKKAPRDECSKCHTLAQNVLEGKGGRGLNDTPGLMSEGVGCMDCHAETSGETKYSAVSLKANRQTCVDCHSEGYDKMVDDWQAEYKSSLQRLENLYAALRVSDFSPGKRESLGATLRDAEYNLEMIRRDGSRGVHNLDYIKALAAKVEENLSYIGQ